MTERPDPRDPKNWPAAVVRSADALVEVVSSFEGEMAVVEVPTSKVGRDGIDDLPFDRWGNREFATYFARQCDEHLIPYVINYPRDVQAMKQIRADLSSVGRGSNDDMRAFLDWTFINRSMISERRGHFTTGSIQGFVSHFLQTIPDETLPRPSWGSPLGENMIIEYKENGSLGLLMRFGIPLAAAFLGKVYPAERVAIGIGSRLAKMIEARAIEDVCKIARQSITASPYIDGFPLLDWRDRFSEIWDVAGCRSQTWWRNDDYPGRPYLEYDEFVPKSA